MESHCIVAIIKKEGRILFLKDARDLMLDYWAPPRGRCEKNDKEEERCVIREVEEETGLKIKPLKKFGQPKQIQK